MAGPASATVLIPAHNEAAVIARCLTALLSDASDGELDVIVVSNGSSDLTESRAREAGAALGRDVRVIALAAPGKPGALRAGLAATTAWPVVVLDADCELSTSAVRALVRALRADGPRLASARAAVSTVGCSAAVRAYYRAWSGLPSVAGGMVGSGVFALNDAAVRRLGQFPDVTNDDGWVRRSFAPDERVTVEEPCVSRAPRTARALVSRRARIVNGNRSLDRSFGPDAGGTTTRHLLRWAGGDLRRWPDLVAFLAITAASRCVALVRRAREDDSWSTDTTSRVPA